MTFTSIARAALAQRSAGAVARSSGTMITIMESVNAVPLGGEVNDAGLTRAEMVEMYPSLGRMMTCKSAVCQGDVQWQPRIKYTNTHDTHILDVYPGDEYCFACGETYHAYYMKMIHEE